VVSSLNPIDVKSFFMGATNSAGYIVYVLCCF